MKTEKRAYAVVRASSAGTRWLEYETGQFALVPFEDGDRVEIRPRSKCGEVMWSWQPARPIGVCDNLQPCEAHPLSVDASEKPSEIRPRVAPGEESDIAGERLVALSWIDLTIGRLSGEDAPAQWVKHLQEARDIVARQTRGDAAVSILKQREATEKRLAAPEGQEAPGEKCMSCSIGEHDCSSDFCECECPTPAYQKPAAPEVPSALPRESSIRLVQGCSVKGGQAVHGVPVPDRSRPGMTTLCGVLADPMGEPFFSDTPFACRNCLRKLVPHSPLICQREDCPDCGDMPATPRRALPREAKDVKVTTRLAPASSTDWEGPRPALPEEVVCDKDKQPHTRETFCVHARPAHPLAARTEQEKQLGEKGEEATRRCTECETTWRMGPGGWRIVSEGPPTGYCECVRHWVPIAAEPVSAAPVAEPNSASRVEPEKLGEDKARIAQLEFAIRWALGEGPSTDGLWFGDKTPKIHRNGFWSRSYLRTLAFPAAVSTKKETP